MSAVPEDVPMTASEVIERIASVPRADMEAKTRSLLNAVFGAKDQRALLTIGIDPGLSGAIAFMADDESTVYDLPVIRSNSLAWIDGAALQSLIINEREGRQATAMIEQVSAMPKQGVTSSFHFGVGFGSILGVLQALSIPIEFVRPGAWKKAQGLNSDKKAALHKARLLYPDIDLHLEKHDGRAEALLIARYARAQAK